MTFLSSNSQDFNAEEAGKRLKQARVLAGFSNKKDFAFKYNINIDTLKSWEMGRAPLSKKGAIKVSQALQSEGVNCSVEWLLHGLGFLSLFDGGNLHDLDASKNILLSQEARIHKEIEFFKSFNKNAAVVLITDSSMEPFYDFGDYVGGVALDIHNLTNFVPCNCIIRTEDNLVLVRYIQPAPASNAFNAICLNYKVNSSICLSNIRLTLIAPIIWHRKKLILSPLEENHQLASL